MRECESQLPPRNNMAVDSNFSLGCLTPTSGSLYPRSSSSGEMLSDVNVSHRLAIAIAIAVTAIATIVWRKETGDDGDDSGKTMLSMVTASTIGQFGGLLWFYHVALV